MTRRANKYAIKGRTVRLPKGCTDEDRQVLNNTAFQLRGVTPEQWEQVFASPQFAGAPRAFKAAMRAIGSTSVTDEIERWKRAHAPMVKNERRRSSSRSQ